MNPPFPLFICGSTASGKSDFALELALRHGGEIVNADAFQLFRGMAVVSAAPTAEALARVPHHLYGVLEPSAGCDARHYAEMARPVIAEILARGKSAIITGGSGLYLKFLTHGEDPLPAGDARLRAELEVRELDDLMDELRRLDPVEAGRVDARNRRYVSRALEICLLSGRPASVQRDAWAAAARQREQNLRGWWLRRTRADLHQRIQLRTAAMLDGGAIEEVAALDGISKSTCEQAIGVREIRALRAGEISRAQCAELIAAATRQYAKRQETWFRRETWLVERWAGEEMGDLPLIPMPSRPET